MNMTLQLKEQGLNIVMLQRGGLELKDGLYMNH